MKRGMTPALLVSIIALVAALIVMLVVVYPPIRELISGTGEKGQCQFSVLLSTLAKKATFSIVDLPASCKTKKITITKTMLQSYDSLAKKATQQYQAKNAVAATFFPTDEKGRAKWIIAKIVSDELINCFDRGWRGTLDLEGASLLELPFKEKGAYLCIICARVKVDDEIKTTIGTGFPLKSWLMFNMYQGKSYYDTLSEGVVATFKGVIDNLEIDAAKTMAVTFVARTGKESWSLSTFAVGGVGIFDYGTLTSDLNFYRSEGLGPFAEPEKGKCTAIIGD